MQLDLGVNDLDSVAHVIQLAVAPVFLLSGVGVTLTVLTNRLARIIDRARSLQAAGAIGDLGRVELGLLSRRAALIQRAILLSTVCALLIGLVIVALFAGTVAKINVSLVVVALFVTAMLAFISGLICFLLEIRLATSTLRFDAPHS